MSATARPRARRIARRSLQLAAIALGLAAAAVSVALIALHSDAGRDRLRRIVESRLDGVLGGPVRIARIEGSVLGEVVVHGIELDGADRRPFVTIGALRLHLQLAPLLRHVARFDAVRAEDVEVAIAPGSVAHRPAAPASAWAIDVADATVVRARVVVPGDARGPALELASIDASGAARLAAGAAWGFRVTLRSSWRAASLPDGVRSGTVVASLVQTPDRGASAWIHATVAGAPVYAGLIGDLDAQHVLGVIVAPAIDLGAATAGRRAGHGRAVIGLSAAAPRGGGLAALAGRALVLADGDIEGHALAVAVASLRVAAGRAHVDARAAGDSGHAAISGDLQIGDPGVTVKHAHVTLTADPRRLTADRVATAAPITAELDVTGPLVPSPRLAVHGQLDAPGPRVTGASAAALRAVFDAHGLPREVAGTAKITVTALRRGRSALGDLTADVTASDDRRMAIAVRSNGAPGGWTIAAAAQVRLGEVIRVELGPHDITAPGQRWRGSGGTIEISDDRVVAHALATAGPGGSIELRSARIARAASGDMAVLAAAEGVDLAALEQLLGLPPAWRGRIDGRVAAQRHAGRWTGSANLAARRVVRAADGPPIDAHIDVAVSAARLALRADAAAPALGRANLACEIVPPADPSDPAAWRRLPRSAIASAHVALAALDLGVLGRVAGLGAGAGLGSLSGEVTVAGGATRGALQLRGLGATLRGRPARVDADVSLASDGPDRIVATARATALGVTASGHVTITPPDRLLDPVAWRALAPGAVRDASLRVAPTALETVLAAFAIASPMTGRFAAGFDMPDLASGAKLEVELGALHGGAIVRPIDATATAAIDDRGAALTVTVRDAGRQLVAGHATAPIDLAAIVSRGFAAARGVPLIGCVTVDAARPGSAPADCRPGAPTALDVLLRVLGRDDATGTLEAALALGGTLGAPSIAGSVTMRDVRGKTVTGDPTPVMHELVVSGQWRRHAFDLVATASEAPGHTLRASARGDLAALDQLQVAIDVAQFDLGPLAAFVPGPLAGAAGVVDGKLAQHGLDPELGLHGKLHIANARMPIAATIGTLQGAALDLTIEHGQVAATLDGRLGNGRVAVTGTASLSRADATSAQATITLHHVSPISATHPVIDARITAQLRRSAGRWRATVVVHDASVTVPDRAGKELHPVGAPRDLVFGDARAPTPARPPVALGRRARAPSLIAVVEIQPTHVKSPEFRGDVAGTLTLDIADTMAIDGSLFASNADVDLLDRRYIVDRAAVHFDGSSDPMLDIALRYDFPDTTLYAKIGGRASKPDLALSSSPAIYTPDQLFGFFVGGAPGGEISKATAATSAAAGAASSMVNVVVNRLLPASLRGNVRLRYEAATATSSAAVVVGLWLTRRLFVAGRSRSAPLQIVENGSEGDLEWWIGGNWMFQGTFGNRSVGGADLLWRYDW